MIDRDYIVNAEQVDIGIKHHFSDSVYAKEMHLPAGHVALSHKHTYSHLSVLSQGDCIVTYMMPNSKLELRKRYSAPAVIEIKAGVEHQIEAITDVTWLCIHATEETDVDKIDKVLIAK